jgi:hypothetical protein
MKGGIGILLVLLWAVPGRAADTLLVVPEVSPSVVRVGETIRVRVVLPGPGVLTGPPAPASEGDLDLRQSQASPAEGDSTAWTMIFAWFRPGEQELPSVPLLFESEGGQQLVRTAPWVISVEATVAGDTAAAQGLRDLKGPVSPELRWRWGRVALAGLGVLALAGLLVWWLRRPRPGALPAPGPPPEPPHRIALRALDELEQAAFPARGRMKDHYGELSHVLRRYVEDRYGIPAVESTTLEIENELPRLPLPSGAGDTLRDLLQGADLVKFAKQDPGSDRAAEDLGQARGWVTGTRPPQNPAPGEEA